MVAEQLERELGGAGEVPVADRPAHRCSGTAAPAPTSAIAAIIPIGALPFGKRSSSSWSKSSGSQPFSL